MTAGEKGLVSQIQRYSTRDGPGLRSTVFLIGCNLRCLWCSNPELMLPGPKLLYHAERCVRCGACAALSGGAIRLTGEGCVIDRETCANLEECAAACFYDAYEKVGYEIGAADLAGRLLRDRAFFDQSGGGVTFSGGEAALQDAFVRETALLLRGQGVHTALDTAGMVPWERLGPLADAVDLVLYDLKAFDPSLHRSCTGADNRLIFENAQRLAESGKPMLLRLVVVPGLNDGRDDLLARLRFAKGLGAAVRQVDLLKYHKLGAGKYRALGIPYPTERLPECPDETMAWALAKARELGLRATIGG